MFDRAVCRHQGEAFNVVAGESVEPGEPTESSSEDQSRRARVRHYACGEDETVFLGCDIDRAEQAAALKTASAGAAVDRYMAHPRQVDHQAVVAGAEAGKAVASTAHRSENSCGCGGPDCGLNIGNVGAAGD